MTSDDRAIAQAANLIAPILLAQFRWTTDQGRKAVPSAAEIALLLRAMINDLVPGVRLESGRVAVDWPDNADSGPDRNIGVYVLVGWVPVTGAALRDAENP